MTVISFPSKPIIEVKERDTFPRSTTVSLKVTFSVKFFQSEGIELEGPDAPHAKYGVKMAVYGFEDERHTRPRHEKWLYDFIKIGWRYVPGGNPFNPGGGRFEQTSTDIYPIVRNHNTENGGQTFIDYVSYWNQTALSQEVSFDLLDVNKRGDLPFRTPPELDIILVRLSIVELTTGRIVKKTRSYSFQGYFEEGDYSGRT